MSLCAKTKRWLKANGDISLAGKTVLVTGANSGVGFKTSEVAVYLGARVILACRNTVKAAAARDSLLKDYPDADIRIMRLDMASLKSVAAFVKELKETGTDIHAFVNNAGTFAPPGGKTADGFDPVMGTNYIGVYYLTELALPYLAGLSHKVVYINTVSVAVMAAKPIDYSDFYCLKKPGHFTVYARSKLCLAKYTFALAKRMNGSGVQVFMSHPGITITPLTLNACGKWGKRLSAVAGKLFNSTEKSSLALAYILARHPLEGSQVGPHLLFNCYGYPRINRLPKKAQTGAEELIDFTEKEIERIHIE